MTLDRDVEGPERQRFGDYEITRFNALRHGVLSRYTVLPWEDENEYRALVEALVVDHRPQGPIEEHLIEELAGIVWRKRRLRLAEASACHRGLKKTTEPHKDTVKAALVHLDVSQQTEGVIASILATSESTARDIIDLEEDEAMTSRAVDVLRDGKAKTYAEALSALREDTRNWWQEVLGWESDDYEEDEKPYAANAADLFRFLEEKVVPWYEGRRKELENRPLIRAQAFGEALDPDQMERLGRYEVHLDRKLERTLAMLIRLQDLRRPGSAN
jgi:hypothetical protein